MSTSFWADGGLTSGRWAGATEIESFDFTLNADPARASLMYPGSKYEHLMLPMPSGDLSK